MTRSSVREGLTLMIALLWITGSVGAQTRVRPGFNLFSPEQDVQLGKEAALEIDALNQVDQNYETILDFVMKKDLTLAPLADLPLVEGKYHV